MNYDDYVEMLKETALRQLSVSAYSFLVSNLPFLAFPPLRFLTNKVIEKVLEHLIFHAELATYFAYTDIRVGRQGKDYIVASATLRAALRTGDAKEIQKAENQLKHAFKHLATFYH